MSEEGTKPSRDALAWVRVVGWQIVALVGVVLIGVGIFRMCGAWTRMTNANAAVAEDGGEIIRFIADCVPHESKPKLKKLINEALDFGAEMGLRELERERRYFDRRQGRDIGMERPRPGYYYDKKAERKPVAEKPAF